VKHSAPQGRRSIEQAVTIAPHRCDCGCGQFILGLRDADENTFAVAGFTTAQFNQFVKTLLDLSKQGVAGNG
jgi:hypothetical protein